MTKTLMLPPLSEWSMHAGGTSVPDKYRGYTIKRNGVQWMIDPIPYGRRVYYQLMAFGLPGERGYTWFKSDGSRNYVGDGIHKTPQMASATARRVHEKYMKRR